MEEKIKQTHRKYLLQEQLKIIKKVDTGEILYTSHHFGVDFNPHHTGNFNFTQMSEMCFEPIYRSHVSVRERVHK